jgi:hypothetical protein
VEAATMTPLEATVEIVKAAIGLTDYSNIKLLTEDKSRENFLKGIEDLYNKLNALIGYKDIPPDRR